MRRTKNRLALYVCLAICLMMFAANELHVNRHTMTLNASSPQTAIVELIAGALNASGEFTITIAVSTQADSYGIAGKVTYDNTRFEYVPKGVSGGQANNVYTCGTSAIITDFVDITASFSQNEFTLATLTFKVKTDAPAGDGIFSYTSLDYFDTLVRTVAVTPVNITVAIEGVTNPSTNTIEVEMDGVDLHRNGEVWSGSVPSQTVQIDTKDIRIYGAPDDAQIEFLPAGIIELEEGVEMHITVTITNDTDQETYTISITRKPAEDSDAPNNPDGTDGNSNELWIIISASIALLILGIIIIRSLTRHSKK